MKSFYNLMAPKRDVNLSLNTDLVAEAKHFTENLSAEVESLLADFVAVKKSEEYSQKNSRHLAAEAWGEFLKSNPSFAEEVSSL
ncbi:type II toxin-antitoxin system CcdA family antitoxin [Xanthomonas citri pv. citri]|uniref:Plasmid maintenance protein CcdB n=3 Tax=Xanthomonas TaxID=338 RepID=A0A3E1KHP4_9XANT|nr:MULTISPECIES: type II toxin-antitoxin system CcdA family antitoxin [Xanthomonas]MCL1531710.1 type II toxin-antitoxin system CcdA family antitoxin [Xanthomonas nasturtii]MCL1566287.1 type II toxin-antitoxin system CcdA family antitoxin [Xanthomonas nasturtii]MCL1567501.1 type II toxin-antitoxin system CcdA family antitoxin [Xanthomonas nasturtii]MCL1574963.1 type II toxin-antitoxin system CcdA family antitoxin [Xanthomonas nasturtii]MCL1579314.1 type II toxin-antitoxin system CcdA family ant